ncbi:zinc-binding metallopeptidase family protein [Hymenobacter rubidus]|uniref:zinc-binding metallopeptidase family protein n=1 Tax=Hymenobacter rubidus TaxID=1441626 RepID=UPI00191F876F|nr:putative zinc-binding peptidase [Hymenobacter rubidus]
MKLFKCTHCGQLLYFENNRCERCHYPLGFETKQLALLPLVTAGEDVFQLYGSPPSSADTYRYCKNHDDAVCNWLVPADSPTPFCTACALNRIIPDLSRPEYALRWRHLEDAKHRLVYTLLRMGLPIVSKAVDPEHGLAFDFKADSSPDEGGEKVLTGHDNGLITINIAEADDIEREMARKAMAETYRTLLGHFRHEVGHYYWDRLIANTPNLDEYRQLFGDERQDYAEALQTHYAHGPRPDWLQHFISAYASSHPWEDWAETWAHYLHILDTLQTAHTFGLNVNPIDAEETQHLQAAITEDPYEVADFDRIMAQWLPLTFAMNSLNRSMGQPDSYPFIISPEVAQKMAFIHRVCRA